MAHDKNWSFGLNNWEIGRERVRARARLARVTKNDGRSEGIKQVFKIIPTRNPFKKRIKE